KGLDALGIEVMRADRNGHADLEELVECHAAARFRNMMEFSSSRTDSPRWLKSSDRNATMPIVGRDFDGLAVRTVTWPPRRSPARTGFFHLIRSMPGAPCDVE